MTSKEQDGVKAIVGLQAMSGVKETEDRALRCWRLMSPRQQTWTLQLHANLMLPQNKHVREA